MFISDISVKDSWVGPSRPPMITGRVGGDPFAADSRTIRLLFAWRRGSPEGGEYLGRERAFAGERARFRQGDLPRLFVSQCGMQLGFEHGTVEIGFGPARHAP